MQYSKKAVCLLVFFCIVFFLYLFYMSVVKFKITIVHFDVLNLYVRLVYVVILRIDLLEYVYIRTHNGNLLSEIVYKQPEAYNIHTLNFIYFYYWTSESKLFKHLFRKEIKIFYRKPNRVKLKFKFKKIYINFYCFLFYCFENIFYEKFSNSNCPVIVFILAPKCMKSIQNKW